MFTFFVYMITMLTLFFYSVSFTQQEWLVPNLNTMKVDLRSAISSLPFTPFYLFRLRFISGQHLMIKVKDPKGAVSAVFAMHVW